MVCPIPGGDPAGLIVGFCAGTLEPAIEVAFERHLEQCSECASLVLAQRNVWRALDVLPSVPVSRDFDEQVYKRIAQEKTLWAQLHPSLSWRYTAPVAAACLALAATFLVKTPPRVDVRPVPAVADAVQIEQVQHALDDMDMLKAMGFEDVGETGGSQPI
jgi:anti-sigma factor RsiW